MIKGARTILFALLLFTLVVGLSMCVGNNDDNKTVAKQTTARQSPLFAGSKQCASCHADIYNKHLQTAHFHTTDTGSASTIKGSFDSGKNVFVFPSGASVKMLKTADGFYQAAYYSTGKEKMRQRFDLVFGSGTRGQSFGAWSGNTLYQLPLTYLTSVDQWCNSPGYPGKIAINRLVTPRCLECHTTWTNVITDPSGGPETYERNSMVLGIDCERCHGSGVEHVQYHQAHPTDTVGHAIIDPRKFSNTQIMDLCAFCHHGAMQKTQPSFSFTAGDKLTDYFNTEPASKGPAASIEVHGNQFGLLTSSKCFQMGKGMTCLSCHDAHSNQRGQTNMFSQKCQGCHTSSTQHNGTAPTCKLKAADNVINQNCTACHMPEMPSNAISVMLQGQDTLTHANMHTHLIRIYPEFTQKVLAAARQPKKA